MNFLDNGYVNVLYLTERSVINMPRTSEQYSQIRRERRVQIMNTALELFAKEGFGHVSIAMLAGKAGISKGLMYNYFSSKEELLKAIVKEGITEIRKSFDPNKDGRLTRDEFILFIRKTFKLMRDDREFWTTFFGLMMQPNVKVILKESAFVPFLNNYLDLFEAYFREQGFKDPMLEVFNLSVSIEGFGILMMYYDDLTDIPQDLYYKFEERIINTYT